MSATIPEIKTYMDDLMEEQKDILEMIEELLSKIERVNQNQAAEYQKQLDLLYEELFEISLDINILYDKLTE